jgi:fibronectin type 3 domain-containing protein
VNLSTATKTTGVASGVADTAGIVNGTTYYYAVTAVNSAGESPASNEASATPSAASPSVAPPAPTGLAATTGNASITLTWSASAGATSYTLYRSSRSPVTLSTATRTPGVASGVVDTAGIANATTYTYVVTAVNVAGESAASNEIAATPMPNCPAGAFDGSLGCLQDLIFTPTCSGCHAGASPPQGLSLDSLSNTRAMTVNMSSAEQPSVLRVKPAAAANSYLYLKVTGASGITGVQMPSGGSPLTSAQTEAIAGWIGAGAP